MCYDVCLSHLNKDYLLTYLDRKQHNIPYLETTVGVDQYVLRFDVAMDNLERMNVFQSYNKTAPKLSELEMILNL